MLVVGKIIFSFVFFLFLNFLYNIVLRVVIFYRLSLQTQLYQTQKKMDFGGLDDILDDDIGYIPTAIKRDVKPRERPTSMSRQNSTKSIGSVKDQKEEKQLDSLFGLVRSSHNEQSMKNSQQLPPNSGRRSTLFGLHKQNAQQQQQQAPPNLNQPPMSFQDFFKTQSNPPQNIHSLSKPPLPEPKTTQRRLEKNSSFTQLGSPENILEDDFNNSSVASRRGRPPLSRRSQNVGGEVEVGNNHVNNRSDSFAGSNVAMNNIEPVMKGPALNINTLNSEKAQLQQPPPIIPNQSFQPLNPPQSLSPTPPAPSSLPSIPDKSLQQLKALFSTQLQYQKQIFQCLIKQQRQSHHSQIQKLTQLHNEQTKRKLQLKQFQLQKMKQFYQLQLKVHTQRHSQVKQYSTIARRLQSNIDIIEKLQRNINQNNYKQRMQKQEQRQRNLLRREGELRDKEGELKKWQARLEEEGVGLKAERVRLVQQISTQRNRIYQLQVQLRSRQTQLQLRHKKLQQKLTQQHTYQTRLLQKQKQQHRIQSLHLTEQRNRIQVQKLQLLNLRKQFDNQRKAQLEHLHGEKTKVMQKEIQIVARVGMLEVKEQEVRLGQEDYLNKVKLVELERRRLEVGNVATKGRVGVNGMSLLDPTRMRGNNNGVVLGTTNLLSRTSQSALNKEFYSNDDYQPQSTSNYKKSITQMRDQFLKSLPKF